MPSTDKTVNYQLSQFTDTDKPKWTGDYNSDMATIDAQMKANADDQAAHKADTVAHLNQLDAKYTPEIGTVTLSNTEEYPFNDSGVTISLFTVRSNLDYTVETEVVSSTGSVERVEVYDKQLNGFKIRFIGSGTAATIKYYVRGGLVR